MRQIEREWIEKLTATLNTDVPSRDKREYRQQNKEKIKERDREYRQQNKDRIAERERGWYQQNKDKIKERRGKKFDIYPF